MKKFTFTELAIYSLFSFYLPQNAIATNLSNNKVFCGIKNIEIGNNLGNVIIKPSKEKDNTVVKLEGEGINEVEIVQKDEYLSIKKENNSNTPFTTTKRVDITVYISPTVQNLTCNIGKCDFSLEQFKGDLSLGCGKGNVTINNIIGDISLSAGTGKFDIDNIQGNISLNTGSLEKGKISNIKGNIDINTAIFDLSLFDVFGNISINCAKGTFNYTMSKKPEFPIKIKTNGAKIDFNINLSSDFKSITNKIKRLRISSSFLPIIKNNGDINFWGHLAYGNLNVKEIKK